MTHQESQPEKKEDQMEEERKISQTLIIFLEKGKPGLNIEQSAT